MPTSSIPEHPALSAHDSLTASKALSGTSYYNSLDHRETQDVFGPVMHNDSQAAHAKEAKKDVGAIGDRRKKDEGYNDISDVRDASDACSTVSPRSAYPHCSFNLSLLASRVVRRRTNVTHP